MLSSPSFEAKEMQCLLFFQARFLVPVQESSQSRRVVVSHNVDKALKEGNGSALVVYVHVNTKIQFGNAQRISDCVNLFHWGGTEFLINQFLLPSVFLSVCQKTNVHQHVMSL